MTEENIVREVLMVDGIRIEVSTSTIPLHSQYSERPEAWSDLINALRQATMNSSLEKLKPLRQAELHDR